jgi:hypothetical protein
MVMNRHRAVMRALPGTSSVWRLLFLTIAVPVALVCANGLAHASEAIDIKLDRAKVMRIARPAATVILGNPAIADATIQDRQTLIITGRSFGTTNLIVLDQAGDPIADEILTVSASNDDVVTVFSGNDRLSFSCSPECQPVLSVGDAKGNFDSVRTQLEGRTNMVRGATSDIAPAN